MGRDHWGSELCDPATGLPTRALFMDRLEQALLRASRRNHVVAVALIEVTPTNVPLEILGENGAEQLLLVISDRLTSPLRADDTVAVHPPDHFAIVLDDVKNATGAQVALARVLHALRMPVKIRGQEAGLAAKCGLCVSIPPHPAAHVLLRNATAALHRARTRAGMSYAIFDPHRDAYALKELEPQAEPLADESVRSA